MRVNINKLRGDRLHIIDVSALARSKWYSFKELSWVVDGKETGTGAIFAVLSILKEIPLEDKIIFCFDFGGNTRKSDYDGYKANRTFKDEEYYNQINTLREILLNCGYDILGQTGYEADDFIVGAAKALENKYDHIVIHSNDKDLTQLVNNKTVFKNIIYKQSDITKDNYEKELKIPYNMIVLYKATVGDPADNIKGIYRFGPKKFEKLVRDLEEQKKYDFANIREYGQEREIIMEYEGITEEHREQALESLRVVLPRLPNNYHFDDIENNPVNTKMIMFYLEKYGMKYIIKHITNQK